MEGDLAFVGLEHAGEDLDQSAFPSPIRSEEGMHLASSHRKVHRPQGDNAAEAFRDLAGGENR